MNPLIVTTTPKYYVVSLNTRWCYLSLLPTEWLIKSDHDNHCFRMNASLPATVTAKYSPSRPNMLLCCYPLSQLDTITKNTDKIMHAARRCDAHSVSSEYGRWGATNQRPHFDLALLQLVSRTCHQIRRWANEIDLDRSRSREKEKRGEKKDWVRFTIFPPVPSYKPNFHAVTLITGWPIGSRIIK